MRGATLYTTFFPCLFCTKLIINAGIAEVVYDAAYALDDVARRLLEEAGVQWFARSASVAQASSAPGRGTRVKP